MCFILIRTADNLWVQKGWMPLPRASSSVPDTYSNPIKFSTPRCSGNFPFSSARSIALAILVKRENYYESAFARERERESKRETSVSRLAVNLFFVLFFIILLNNVSSKGRGRRTTCSPDWCHWSGSSPFPYRTALRLQGSIRILFKRCLPSIPASTWTP